MSSVLGVAAAAWGVVMALAPVLQIRRMIIRRSSADLSMGYFGLLLPGFGLWVGYGLARGDWPLVIPNLLALAVGLVTVAIGAALRVAQRRADAAAAHVAHPFGVRAEQR